MEEPHTAEPCRTEYTGIMFYPCRYQDATTSPHGQFGAHPSGTRPPGPCLPEERQCLVTPESCLPYAQCPSADTRHPPLCSPPHQEEGAQNGEVVDGPPLHAMTSDKARAARGARAAATSREAPRPCPRLRLQAEVRRGYCSEGEMVLCGIRRAPPL